MDLRFFLCSSSSRVPGHATKGATFAESTVRPSVYRNYLLILLLALNALNNADYVAVGIALQSIKLDLHLSDTEVGLLTGLALAAFSATGGIAIARWIDRGSRVKILAIAAAVWSVTVVLTGRAMSFGQMLLARLGVGLGDAATFPMAQSIIPDYFTRAERPHATAVFMLGWPAALLVGLLAGGWLNQLYGWRTMFLVIGAPGVVLAALVGLTLKEPRHERSVRSEGYPIASETVAESAGASMSSAEVLRSGRLGVDYANVKEVFVTLWRSATYRNLLLCYTVSSFFRSGVFQWQPAFFMRSFGLQSGEVGTWLALVLGAGSLISIYAGGMLASRYAANNERLQFRLMAVSYVGFGITHALAYLSPYAQLAFVLLGVGSFVNAVSGPLLASIQTLAPARTRAVSYAIFLLFSSLIGMGLGPLAVGLLSDALHPLLGRESMRYALLALCPGFAWGAWYAWRASNTVTRDLAVLLQQHDREHAIDPVSSA